jgi:hypothetical protein
MLQTRGIESSLNRFSSFDPSNYKNKISVEPFSLLGKRSSMTMKASDLLKVPIMIELLEAMENEFQPTKEQQEQLVSLFSECPIIDCHGWENTADCAKFQNLLECVIDPILEAHSAGVVLPKPR